MAQNILAKLRLLDYIVLNFNFESDGVARVEQAPAVKFGMDFDIHENSEDAQLYRVDLHITINETDEAYGEAGFRITAVISGIFEFDEDMDKEDMESMIAVNGLSMLFSTARGVIAQLTAQTLPGKFVLPSINIVEFLRLHTEEHEAKEKQQQKKKKARSKT